MGTRHAWLAGLGFCLIAFGGGSKLIYIESSRPTTLNPLYAQTMVDRRTQELIFDRLFFWGSIIDSEIRSQIVERWEVFDDNTAIRLTLRPKLTFHDGSALNAKDVCFTVDAMLDLGTPSPAAAAYRDVLAGCTVESRRVATIRFTRPAHTPRELLDFAILPDSAFSSTAITPDLGFSSRPIGSGPMRAVQGRYGVEFAAYANAHHPAKIQAAMAVTGGDPRVQLQQLRDNDVQGIIAVPPMLYPEVRADDTLSLRQYVLQAWWFVAVNVQQPALQDQRVRHALDLLLDRAALQELSFGVKPSDPNPPSTLISGPFIPASPYSNRSVSETPHDPAQAARLLEMAGWTREDGQWMRAGQPVTLRIGMLSTLDTEAPDLLSQIANQLRAAGLQATITLIPPDAWDRRVLTGKQTDLDLAIGRWVNGTFDDVSPFFHTRAEGQGARNLFHYTNPKVDQLLEAHGQARTDIEARDVYHELHEVLAEDRPYLFLWQLNPMSAWRKEVRSAVISPYYYFSTFARWEYTP